MIAYGSLIAPVTLAELETRIAERLNRTPLVIGDSERLIKRIAWCSGGAQGYFEAASALGVDAYLTGEASEQNAHYAAESGCAFIAAGHHAKVGDDMEGLIGADWHRGRMTFEPFVGAGRHRLFQQHDTSL